MMAVGDMNASARLWRRIVPHCVAGFHACVWFIASVEGAYEQVLTPMERHTGQAHTIRWLARCALAVWS